MEKNFIEKIFHPSDFSKSSEVAFAHALKLALLNKAELGIFHSVHHDEYCQNIDYPRVRATLERWKVLPPGSTQEQIADAGLRVKKIKVQGDDTVNNICSYLEQHPVDLLVLMTHQRKGLERLLHKSIAEPVAREARAMTLFIPHEREGFISTYNGSVALYNILIPIDHTPSPQFALETATFLAQSLQCEKVCFHILYVGKEENRPPIKMPERPQWQWKMWTRNGPVAKCIKNITEEQQISLVVMSTMGHDGFLDALRGSTTERVVREATCPVLAIAADI